MSCDPNGTTDFTDDGGDPNLLALGDHGGPTLTRPPAPPTLAIAGVIDLGINSTPALSTDQRGLDRTMGWDIDDAGGGDGTDIGAVEIQAAEITSSDPPSPGDEPDPTFFGTSELDTSVSLFDGGSCGGTAIDTASAANFADPEEGIFSDATFGANSSNQVSVNAGYGTATSDCAPFTYQRVPHEPELESTDPASGANDNNPKVKGSIDVGLADPADVTIDVYGTNDCAGSLLGTGTAEDLEGAGVPTTVPDNSTTTFYATSSGVGGTSECSETSVTYTEVTPPVTPITPVTPTPTKKKCKKGQKLKKGKCVKKKRKKKK